MAPAAPCGGGGDKREDSLVLPETGKLPSTYLAVSSELVFTVTVGKAEHFWAKGSIH